MEHTEVKVGDTILVHGFVMLAGLDGGKKYVVHAMDDTTITFRLARGKKLCRHYKYNLRIRTECGDNNWIQKL